MLAYTQGAQTGPDTIPLENQDPYFFGPNSERRETNAYIVVTDERDPRSSR